jgi:streptogramin lyase
MALALFIVAVVPLPGERAALAAHTRAAAKLAQVQYIDHGLSVQPPKRHMQKGHKKQTLYSKYFLRTQKKQRASIQFRDRTTLQMNQQTDAVLRSPHITTVKKGEVEELVAPGSDHRVQAGSALASAIGTDFDVRVAGKVVTIAVVHGAVLVHGAHGSVVVTTNHETTVKGNAAPTPPRPVNSTGTVAWTKGIPAPNLGENWALAADGGRIASVSSQATAHPATNLIDGRLDTAWESASGKPTGQTIVFGLNGPIPYTTFSLNQILIDPAAPAGRPASEDLRAFQVRVSITTASPDQFRTVLTATARQNAQLQAFQLPAGTQARYVELVEQSNYGSTTAVAATEVEIVGAALAIPLTGAFAGMTVAPNGDILVTDAAQERVLRLSSTGQVLSQFGSGTGKPFSELVAVTTDRSGNIYALSRGGLGDLQKFTSSGTFVRDYTTLSSQGGPGNPLGVAIGPDGTIYLADQYYDDIARLSPSGAALSPLGTAGSNPGQFDYLQDVATDSSGNLYTVEGRTRRVQELKPDGTVVRTWTSAKFQFLNRVAIDAHGDVYVTDSTANTLTKLLPDGSVAWTVGTHGSAPGQFGFPGGVAVDSAGNVYVADNGDQRIQKFSPAGKLLQDWG